MIPPLSAEDAADGLRDQAASCRQLAKRARTATGGTALRAVADRFETVCQGTTDIDDLWIAGESG